MFGFKAKEVNQSVSRSSERRFSKTMIKHENQFYHISDCKKSESVALSDLQRKMLAEVDLCDLNIELPSLLLAELYDRYWRVNCIKYLTKHGDECDEEWILENLQIQAMKSVFPHSPFSAGKCQLVKLPGVTNENGQFVDKSLAHFFSATYLVKAVHLPSRPKNFDKFFFKLLSEGNWFLSFFNKKPSWDPTMDFVSQLLLQYGGDLGVMIKERYLQRHIYVKTIESVMKNAAKEGRGGIIKFIFHSLKKSINSMESMQQSQQRNSHFNEDRLASLILLAAEHGHVSTIEVVFDVGIDESIDMKDVVRKLFNTFNLRVKLLRCHGRESFIGRLMEYLVEHETDPEDLLYPHPLSSTLVEGAAVEKNAKLLDEIFDFAHRHQVPCSFVLQSFVLGTPLHSAAVGGSVEVIEKIVKFAVDNNFEVAELMGKKLGGQTPVHLAALHGNADAVAALLKVAAENGIDRNWLLGPDNCGKTPFHMTKAQSVINALMARYN
jgi:hypothetical protein